jgi:hypothetical protein
MRLEIFKNCEYKKQVTIKISLEQVFSIRRCCERRLNEAVLQM